MKAIINITDNSNRVLNIIKAKFGLKDKSAAIDMMATQYEEEVLEPKLRPEYVKKIKKIMKEGKFIHVGSIENFEKRYNLK